MRVSKAQAAQNRQHMLTAATRLFREQGIQATGVDAITHREGMREIGNGVVAMPTPCYCPPLRVRPTYMSRESSHEWQIGRTTWRPMKESVP
jgi:hypothetical protein